MTKFETLCKRLGVEDKASKRSNLLLRALTAHQTNTILFMICTMDYLKKPSAKKLTGIYKLFIIPPPPSLNFLDQNGLLTLNLDSSLTNRVGNKSALGIYVATMSPFQLFENISGDEGLNSENAMADTEKKVKGAKAADPNKLTEYSQLLHPYWGAGVEKLGLPKPIFNQFTKF